MSEGAGGHSLEDMLCDMLTEFEPFGVEGASGANTECKSDMMEGSVSAPAEANGDAPTGEPDAEGDNSESEEGGDTGDDAGENPSDAPARSRSPRLASALVSPSKTTVALRCVVCLMSSSGHDLASTDKMARTPFRAPQAPTAPMCANCDSFFRYHHNQPSAGRSAAVLALQYQDPHAREAFLVKFACVMALKSEEGCTRISRVVADKRVAFATKFTSIMEQLWRRHGSATEHCETTFVALEDYIQLHRNPWSTTGR